MRFVVLLMGIAGCLSAWTLEGLWMLQVTSPELRRVERVRRDLEPLIQREMGRDLKELDRFFLATWFLLAALPLGLGGTVLAFEGRKWWGAMLLCLAVVGPAILMPPSLYFTFPLLLAALIAVVPPPRFRDRSREPMRWYEPLDEPDEPQPTDLEPAHETIPSAQVSGTQWIRRLGVLILGLLGATLAGWIGIQGTLHDFTKRELWNRPEALGFPMSFPGWVTDVLVPWFLIATIVMGAVGASLAFFRLGVVGGSIMLAAIIIPSTTPSTIIYTWPLIVAGLASFTIHRATPTQMVPAESEPAIPTA